MRDRRAYDKARYQANREAWKARNARWRDANRKKIRAKERRRRNMKIEHYKEYDRAYYLANREAILARKALAHRINRESDNARARARYHENKKQVTEQQWSRIAKRVDL